MSTLPEFRNEPLTDFTKPERQSAMNLALAKVTGEMGREHPIVIGGERITGLKTFDSLNPANRQVVGKFQEGSAEHVERAMEAAWTAFESWKRESVGTRANSRSRRSSRSRTIWCTSPSASAPSSRRGTFRSRSWPG